MIVVWWLVIGAVCAGICATLARHKVAHPERWALYGLLFGVFAVGYLLMLPNVFSADADTPLPHGVAPGRAKGKKRVA